MGLRVDRVCRDRRRNIQVRIEVSTLFSAFDTFPSQLYGLNPGRLGLALGLSLLVGSSLGELASGPIMDARMRRARKRAPSDDIVPEVRLGAIWTGAILVPVRIISFFENCALTHTPSIGRPAHLRAHCSLSCPRRSTVHRHGRCLFRITSYRGESSPQQRLQVNRADV